MRIDTPSQGLSFLHAAAAEGGDDDLLCHRAEDAADPGALRRRPHPGRREHHRVEMRTVHRRESDPDYEAFHLILHLAYLRAGQGGSPDFTADGLVSSGMMLRSRSRSKIGNRATWDEVRAEKLTRGQVQLSILAFIRLCHVQELLSSP